jgi:hypothetical protein
MYTLQHPGPAERADAIPGDDEGLQLNPASGADDGDPDANPSTLNDDPKAKDPGQEKQVVRIPMPGRAP